MTPFFSIILPVYNRAAFIETAVNSVLAQEFKDWELIIIDDGSTDSTGEIVKKYRAHRNIRYIYQHNQERSVARNNGIDAANGRFICFLDSDDLYLPNHLSVLHKTILSHNEKPALYYTAYYVETGGKRTRNKGYSRLKNKGLHNIMFEELLQTNSVCIHAGLLIENKFPLQFNMFEDNHLWWRVVAKSEMIYIDTPTTVIIDHDTRSLRISASQLKTKWQKYVAVLTDLFYQGKYPFLDELISEDKKKEFIASKAIVMAYEALVIGDLSLAYHFLFTSLRYKIVPRLLYNYIKLFAGAPFFILKNKMRAF